MNSRYGLLGGLLLVCVAGFALFGAGCGSSSTSSNTSLEILQSNLTINDGTGGSISMSFWVLGCSVTVNGNGLTFTDPNSSGPNCFNAPPSQIKGWTPGSHFAYTPIGFVIDPQTDPVPPQGSTPIDGILVELDNSGNYYVFDYTGTAYAKSQSISGAFTCDANQSTQVGGQPICSGQEFNFSGSVTPTE